MAHASSYLLSIGVKVLPGETAKAALLRHAAEHNWRKKTLERHAQALELNLQLDLQELANSCFDNLEQLNTWLMKFRMEPQTSKKKAVAALKEVHINIYDLLAERFEKKFATVSELRSYSQKNDLIFPREKAKAEGLRCFLRHFSVGSARGAASVGG